MGEEPQQCSAWAFMSVFTETRGQRLSQTWSRGDSHSPEASVQTVPTDSSSAEGTHPDTLGCPATPMPGPETHSRCFHTGGSQEAGCPMQTVLPWEYAHQEKPANQKQLCNFRACSFTPQNTHPDLDREVSPLNLQSHLSDTYRWSA